MFGLFESNDQKKSKMTAKGFSAMSEGRFRDAEGCFLRAIELDILGGSFNAAEAWIGLGTLYFSLGSYQKAKGCFVSAIDQSHGDYHAIRGLALVERKLENDDRAEELFRQLEDKFGYMPAEDPTLSQSDRDWLSGCGL